MSNTAENMGYLAKGTLDSAATRGFLSNAARDTMLNSILQIYRNANPSNPVLTEAEQIAANESAAQQGKVAK